jgi:hypothetical protein
MTKRKDAGQQSSGQKRIVDLEVDENSLVDKPAIGESFFLIKRMKDGTIAPLPKEIIQKASGWMESVKKSETNAPDTCVFCKVEGGREPKLGLLCSVCFSCASERIDKGVFDACIEGTFDIEKYRVENPDELQEPSTTKADPAAPPEEKTNEEGERKPTESPDKQTQENPDNLKSDPEKPAETSVEIKLVKLEKQVEDLVAMLQESLGLHESAAQALNQAVALIASALEQLATLSTMDTGGEGETEETMAAAKNVQTCVQALREQNTSEPIEKVGAKISSARMQMLRDLSEKLAELLGSLVDSRGKDGKQNGTRKDLELVVTRLGDVEAQIKELASKAEDLPKLVKRIDDLENTSGASGALDGDEEPSPKTTSKKSLFSDVIGLSDIKQGIDARDKFLKRKRTTT